MQAAWISRLVALVILFSVELLVITIRLDDARLSQSGLAGGIRIAGIWVLRGLVGWAALYVTFAFLKSKAALDRLAVELAEARVSWPLLGAHAAAMGVFAGFSSALFGHTFGESAPNLIAAGWLLAGILGIVAGVCAFFPARLLAELFRETQELCVYSAAGAIFALVTVGQIQKLWQPAANLTLTMVRVMLAPFVRDFQADPSRMIIRSHRFTVIISPECSGLEGAGLMLVFGVVWLCLFRKECRFPQALLLLPVGVVLVYLLNAVRLAALFLIGDAGAKQIAAGGFHSQAGWIAFNSVAFGLCVAARRSSWFSLQPVRAKESVGSVDNATSAYLVPFLAILAGGMASRAMTGAFEWAYPLRMLAAAAALWSFRRHYRHVDWRFGWLGVAAGTLVFFLWVGLDRIMNVPAVPMPHALEIASWQARSLWLTCRVLAAVVTVPLAEELAFRGFLMRRLGAEDFEAIPLGGVPWYAILVSSGAFGLMHGDRWLAGIAAGGVYGLVAVYRGRLGEAVAAHAVTNALLCVSVLALRQWQFW